MRSILLDPILDEVPLISTAVHALHKVSEPELYESSMMSIVQEIFEPRDPSVRTVTQTPYREDEMEGDVDPADVTLVNEPADGEQVNEQNNAMDQIETAAADIPTERNGVVPEVPSLPFSSVSNSAHLNTQESATSVAEKKIGFRLQVHFFLHCA